MADKVIGYIGRKSSSTPSGTEPPDDGMELIERVGHLETDMRDVRDRLVHIETKVDTFATKSDLHEALNSQTWKLITFVCGFGSALVAITYFIATHVK